MAEELKPANIKEDINTVIHAPDDGKIDAKERAAFWRLWDEAKPILKFIVAILASMGIWTGGEAVVDSMSASALPPKVKDEPTPAKLTLEVPATVDAEIGGQPARIAAKSAGRIRWLVPTSAKATAFESGGELVVVPMRDASDFELACVAIDGDRDVSAWVRVRVKGGLGPQPPPKPEPTDPLSQILEQLTRNTSAIASLDTRLKALEAKPDPKPDPPKPPVPVVDSLTIVTVWESADSVPEISKVLKDYAFWKSLEPLGVKWFQLDKDDKNATGGLLIDSLGYRKHVEKEGLPVMIVMDKTGHVIEASRLPSSTAAIRDKVKSYLGK